VEVNHRHNLTCIWILFFVKLLKYLWADLSFILNSKLLNQPMYKLLNINSKNTYTLYSKPLDIKFKSLYQLKLTNKIRTLTKTRTNLLFRESHTHTKMISVLRVFLNTNTFTNTTLLRMHHSWVSYYFGVGFGYGCVICIRKFFMRWKKTYYLIFNLFYYRIHLLVFGTSFFKKELLALNWSVNVKLLHIWRYVAPFFYFKPSRIFDDANYIFHKLKLLGLNIALVIDVAYHHKTLYYLNNVSFYTIGVVPLNLNMYSVNFAVPTSSESLFTQLFFIRFFFSVRKKAKHQHYLELKKTWFNFYSSF
jgi:hypothetical protein